MDGCIREASIYADDGTCPRLRNGDIPRTLISSSDDAERCQDKQDTTAEIPLSARTQHPGRAKRMKYLCFTYYDPNVANALSRSQTQELNAACKPHR